MWAKHPRLARKWTEEEKVMKYEPRFGSPVSRGTRQTEARTSEIYKRDWQNISEHERRARDSRRTVRRGLVATGAAAGGAGVVLAHHADSRRKFGRTGPLPLKRQFAGMKNAAQGTHLSYVTPRAWGASRKEAAGSAARYVKDVAPAVARHAPHALALTGLGAVGAGGLAAAGAGRLNEKRHDRAIARQRKARASRQPVEKRYRDYDPERRRQRDIGAAEATLGIGGAAGAGYGGHRIYRDTKARRARLKKPKGVFEIHGKPAAALGAGLAGLAAVPAIHSWSESNRGKPWH